MGLENEEESSEKEINDRRNFLKFLGGVAGIGTVSLLPTVKGLEINSDSGINFGGLSSGRNFEIGSEGTLDFRDNDLNNIASLEAQSIGSESQRTSIWSDTFNGADLSSASEGDVLVKEGDGSFSAKSYSGGSEGKFVEVSSASELNNELQAAKNNGNPAYIRWKPGQYDGTDWTEQVVVPHYSSSIGINAAQAEVVLDMRGVYIDIGPGEGYEGENGAFIYKEKSGEGDGSSSMRFDLYGPTFMRIKNNVGDYGNYNIFEFWDTRNSKWSSFKITANPADRILRLGQTADSGHHCRTQKMQLFGGGKCVQIGQSGDPYGKDRGEWQGQVAGWREAGVHVDKALMANVDIQPERPSNSGDADPDNAGVRVTSSKNQISMNHIKAGHPIDVQAHSVKVDIPGMASNGDIVFGSSRLGVRPTNLEVANVAVNNHDMSHNPLNDFQVSQPGSAQVKNQAGARGGRAIILDPGSSGDKSSIRVPGITRWSGNNQFLMYAHLSFDQPSENKTYIGPYQDESRYFQIGLDDSYSESGRVRFSNGSGTSFNNPISQYLKENNSSPIDVIWYCGQDNMTGEDYQMLQVNNEIVYEGYNNTDNWTSLGWKAQREDLNGNSAGTTTSIYEVETMKELRPFAVY